jgi:hypothetical protein
VGDADLPRSGRVQRATGFGAQLPGRSRPAILAFQLKGAISDLVTAPPIFRETFCDKLAVVLVLACRKGDDKIAMIAG